MTPPMIARPIGAWISPPSFSASASGSMPKIIAAVVMMIGRIRTSPACSSASGTDRPARRPWLAKSTSRIAFFVTRPISITRPIIENRLMRRAGREQRQHHADQRQRQRGHDRQRLQEAAELRRQDDVDEDHRRAERHQHALEGLGLLLGLAADVEAVAGRQLRRLDDLLHVGADVAARPALRAGVDRLAALQVLALDDDRIDHRHDVGDARQLDRRAVLGVGDRQAVELRRRSRARRAAGAARRRPARRRARSTRSRRRR